ncbi:MAG: hypothetical protein L0226_10920 [Acidobacteria bacterium]|nr:hypothetical protein [Acidobacteriota bacterium]MCI0609534.1 hypothetical protein [Anaerolineae bacterium]
MMKDSKNRRLKAAAIIAVISGMIALATMPFDRVGGNSSPSQPACVISDSAGKAVQNNNDPLAKLLLSGGACPPNVFDLRARLLASGAKIKTAFVANRGFHNTAQGSFSIFELVSGRLSTFGIELADGEFFFGHFTARIGNKLIANQQPNGLMVELIAWDPVKKLFNFYELIGDGQRSQWFYRGDSLDIVTDVELLHRQPDPNRPQFGRRLRCSGCHIAGGPIMKELTAPHNDWWMSNRRLPFGGSSPDAELTRILNGLVDADELAGAVKAGLAKLGGSEKFQQAVKARPLQEQLRPLFCPVELNLESDPRPLDELATRITIPSAFFVHPLLAQKIITINRADYGAALLGLKAAFPEALPKRPDGDHGWLTPVKAFSDTMAIESLVKRGLIDQEFVGDVLAVDLTNPVFSTARCNLLRLLPSNADADWQKTFRDSLKAAANNNPAAQELLNNLADLQRDARFHQTRAARLLDQCQTRLQNRDAVIKLFQLLAQRRAEAFDSEISKNPRGQILEPGFRVIFPTVTPPIRPGSFRLTEDGLVIRQ